MATFFITAKPDPADSHHPISPFRGLFDADEQTTFDEIMFPLAVVTVVCLQSEIRPFSTRLPADIWRSFLFPGNVPIQVAHWCPMLEFWDKSLTIDGKQTEPAHPGHSLADRVVGHACCISKLLTSYKAAAGHVHAFITERELAHYHLLPCSVSMRINSWADVPRCTESYDDALRGGNDFIHPRKSAVERFVDSAAIGPNATARAAFCEGAKALCPQSGSFIPCSLWYGAERYESECVLEVLDDVSKRDKQCHLHVLSQFEDVKLLNRMELKLTVEVFDRVRREYRKVVTDLCEIITQGGPSGCLI